VYDDDERIQKIFLGKKMSEWGIPRGPLNFLMEVQVVDGCFIAKFLMKIS
jgi:hypothetical protein